MKKALSLILVLVFCLSLCACGDSENLKKVLCTGEWVSTNNINSTLGSGYSQSYPIIRFFENGTCEKVFESYKDDVLISTSKSIEHWQIKNGKIAISPDIVDSDTDTTYYEFSDGKLIGSAWYCDRFTYVQNTLTNTEPSHDQQPTETTQAQPTETTQAPITYYEGTLFLTIDAYVDCVPTLTNEELWTIYNYTDITNHKEFDEYMHYKGKYMIAFDDYARDILGNYTKKDHYEDQENCSGLTTTIWYDGNGFALARRFFLKDKKECRLAIYIMEESNVPAYLEHFFNG